MAFVDLEKAFDSVSQEVVRQALSELEVNEWSVEMIKSMELNGRMS